VSNEVQSSVRKYFDIAETIKRVGKIKNILSPYSEKDIGKEELQTVGETGLEGYALKTCLHKKSKTLWRIFTDAP